MSDLIGWVFSIGGLLGVVWTSHALLRALRSAQWPRAPGEVLKSTVESRLSDGMRMYRAAVSYKYRVGSRELISKRVFFGDMLEVSWAGPATQYVSKYQPGTEVSVAYDPEDPATAVLEPGANWQTYSGLILTIVIGSVGAAVLLGLIRF